MLRLLPVDQSAHLGEQLGIVDWLATANIFRGLLESPSGAAAVYGIIDKLFFHGALAARTRELVILRIGWRARSEYVFCNHVRISREIGIPDPEILGTRNPGEYRAYSDTDRRVLDLADELYDSARVAPGTWAALGATFTSEELVELVLVAGLWRAIAGFVNTAGTPLDADTPSWP
ncbi:MAG TPA: carboxymuconolactone decarboxylase family protein [Gemmatimonadaceae bacterium]|nr:carboxymuconolactone decarboxylase family protein [Gemmatimonadaceae bacterium]